MLASSTGVQGWSFVMAAKTSQQITGNAQLQEGSLGAPQDQPIPHASHHAANHTQPQAKLTTNQHAPLLTCPVTHNRRPGRCLSSQNAQTVTPGRHHTQLLVAPWLQEGYTFMIATKTQD